MHLACIVTNKDAVELLIELGVDINAADKHGSTALHVVAACYKNATCEEEEEEEVEEELDVFYDGRRLPFDVEYSEKVVENFTCYFHSRTPSQTLDCLRLLVSSGGNSHSVNSKGHTPLSLTIDPTIRLDMVFLTRRPLLLFAEAISTSRVREGPRSLHRVAGNRDLMHCILRFL